MVTRRHFVGGLSLAVLGAAANRLGRVGAAALDAGEGPVDPKLVGLIRDVPRARLLEALTERIRNGLAYPELLGAVAEAAAREVSPYPVVGFKYHAFMVMQSVHLTTVNGRTEDRWLPVLWAADLFKAAQAQDDVQTGWTMGPVPKISYAGLCAAQSAFVDAMERWDAEAADAALLGVLQTLPAERVFDLLFRYAARDFRHIGHKAITATNCHRLIRLLGPGRAIPLLRSLTYALQNYGEGPDPAHADLKPDRPWRRNLALAATVPSDWLTAHNATFDPVTELLPVLREGSAADAAQAVVTLMARGAAPAQIWSAMFAGAGELLLRQSGIYAVHAHTTCNALHYAFRHTQDDWTRRMLLLQAAAFLPLFRVLVEHGKQRQLTIDGWEALAPSATGAERVSEIFAELHLDRIRAARKALAYLADGGSTIPFKECARHYTVTRNSGFHDYKLTEALFENARGMHSPWRERYLGAGTLYLNGAGDPRNGFVAQASEMLM